MLTSIIKLNRYMMKSNNDLHNRFILTLLITLISTLLGSFSFNYLVDPYGLFNSPKLLKINQIKPYQESQIRLSKLLEIKRKKPEIIIIGSSRILSGMNLDNSSLSNARKAYNLGLPGAYSDEITYYIEYIINYYQSKPKTIIVGLDFFMFNEYEHDNGQKDLMRKMKKGSFPRIEAVKTSFSVDTLLASKKTVINNIKDRGKNEPKKSNRIDKFRYWLSSFLDKDQWFMNYTLSHNKITEIKKIVDLCQKNNIELVFFISPTHTSHYEAIRLLELWPIFEEWKKIMVTIAPVWDFSGYNRVTSEKISEKMEYYLDNSHYSPQVGDLILKRIFQENLETVPDDFGTLIIPNNINVHLMEINKNRQQWVENNPDDLEFVLEIKNNLETDH